MPAVPAVCDNCGALFPSGIALGDNVTGATMVNVSAGPCPRCGGVGRVRDGVYSTGPGRPTGGPAPSAPPRPSGGPSRNGPCPCGSGRKYKRCHGAT